MMLLTVLSGCAHPLIQVDKSKLSPFGTYTAVFTKADNTKQIYQLTINEDSTYQLCYEEDCEIEKVEQVPANYGLILVNFYSLVYGKELERYSFARPVSDRFYQKIVELRRSQPRSSDLAFNLTYCGDKSCFRLGHSRRGVVFIRSHIDQLRHLTH